MRISDWSSDVCSSDLGRHTEMPEGLASLELSHWRHAQHGVGRAREREGGTHDRKYEFRFGRWPDCHRTANYRPKCGGDIAGARGIPCATERSTAWGGLAASRRLRARGAGGAGDRKSKRLNFRT